MLLIGLNPFKTHQMKITDQISIFYFHLLLISRREMSDALDERA